MRTFHSIVLITAIFMSTAAVPSYAQSHSPPAPPGRLIDIGGYRLHLQVTGKREPAVVLIAGAGDFSFDWSLVQPAVARFSRVCSYDRAGFAWSDLGPTPRTMKQEAYELHLLLKKAGIKGPYVLVGHSLGGLVARIYSDMYPTEVAGIVLVDSTHEDTTLFMNGKITHMRELAKNVAIPPVQTMKSSPSKPATEEDKKQADMNAKVFGRPKIEPPFDKLPVDIQNLRLWWLNHPKRFAETDTFFAEELQAMYAARTKTPCPLVDKPLITMVGTGEPLPSEEKMRQIMEEKLRQKEGFASLSRNSMVVHATRSGHHIQLDEPDLVIDAIKLVVEAARKHIKLDGSTKKG